MPEAGGHSVLLIKVHAMAAYSPPRLVHRPSGAMTACHVRRSRLSIQKSSTFGLTTTGPDGIDAGQVNEWMESNTL
jgi:hypothetical protein